MTDRSDPGPAELRISRPRPKAERRSDEVAEVLPPHDSHAERAILGGCLLDYGAYPAVSPLVRPADFFFPAHAVIYESVIRLAERHEPIDVVTLSADLKARNRLQTVGGAQFIGELSDSSPTIAHIAEHARIVADLSAVRQMITAAQEITARGYDARGNVGQYLSFARERLTRVASALPGARVLGPPILSLGEQLLLRANASEPVSTGFPSIDSSTNGGLRGKKFVVVGGAPGAGKTTMVCALSKHFAEHGAMVGVLATDEPAEGLNDRFARAYGADTESLDNDPGVRAEFANILDEYLSPNLILAEQHEGHTLESLASELEHRSHGKDQLLVLVIDSLQTFAAYEIRGEMQPRDRVTLATRLLHAYARRGYLVIVTSELSRGAYRSNDPSQRTEDLAAFKESGAIEYGVDLAMVLRLVKDGSTAEHVDVDAAIAKNRMRRGHGVDTFRVRIQRTSAAIVELVVDEPTLNPAYERERALRAEDQRTAEKILAAVRALPGQIPSKNALLLAAHVGRTRGLGVVDLLIGSGQLRLVGGRFRCVSQEHNAVPADLEPSSDNV